MSITFDSVTLSNPSPVAEERDILINSVRLISGKKSIQASSVTAINVTFTCRTTSYSEITTLEGKIGTSGSLVIGTVTYTKCYISGFNYSEVDGVPNVWDYTVSFIQDTT